MYAGLMKNRFFRLRIHCWGGLGSQLFAANLAFDLMSRFPKRDLVIVLHSGGVTERRPELPDIFPNFRYDFIDDYVFAKQTPELKHNLLQNFRRLIFGFFRLIGLMVTLDEDDDLKSVRNWTIAVRGHYSYRSISSNFLESFYKNLEKRNLGLRVFDASTISLHYRLGDLLTLQEKDPVHPDRVVQILNTIGQISPNAQIDLYSDSPIEALNLLKKSNLGIMTSARYDPVLQLIINCANSDHFIGTSSKISFWVAIIRTEILKKTSYLPREKLMEFKWLSRTKNLINYY